MNQTSEFQISPTNGKETLVDAIRLWARTQPSTSAVRFLSDGEIETKHLTYFELDREARKIAAVLQRKCQKGERVLLCFPPGVEFVAALLGCFYSGVIAVPIYPPGNRRGHGRILGVLDNCQARFVLTVKESMERLEIIRQDISTARGFEMIATDLLDVREADQYLEYRVSPSELAFLQYTSGSTGDPKGSMISHQNLATNIQMLVSRGRFSKSDSIVTWLPIYHDMGLIGTLLMPLYVGIAATLMPPASFIMKPIRWFAAFSKYRGTASASPNFAYELCLRKIRSEDLKGLDLSSIRILFNGAEPIRADAMRKLSQLLSSAGFANTVFLPSYGLAEATLIVSGIEPKTLPRTLNVSKEDLEKGEVVHSTSSSAEITSCGKPCDGIQLSIVDPETGVSVGDKRVGEIWLSGGSICQGYWNNEAATDAAFGANLKGTSQKFLRTGDLGFIDRGELFVTGRLKDMIILNGRNLYPQDIEISVEKAHSGVRPGCAVAFSTEEGNGEEVCVVLELDRNFMRQEPDSIRDAILLVVGQDHDVALTHIIFLKHGGLPKTSSGKLQRRLTYKKWKQDQLEPIYSWSRKVATPTESNTTEPVVASPHRKELQETLNWLRNYGETRINSRLMDERRMISPHVVLDMGNRGLLGMIVPTEYGGPGFSYKEIGLITQQLAAIDLSLAIFVGLNNALGIYPVLKFASIETKKRLLPQLASGRILAAFALTERGAGSNPQALQTTALKAPGGHLLFGEKIWIGNASWASVISVFAKEKSTDGAIEGISGFVVESHQPGYRNGPEALTMGVRSMVQNSVLLDSVFVPDLNRLGKAEEGMEVASAAMNFARSGLANICIGALKRCLQWMSEYAQQRNVSTGKLSSNAVTLSRLHQSVCAVRSLEVLCNKVNDYLDQGKSVPDEIYLTCKILAPELLWRTVDWCMQLLGGRGYIETNLIPQMMRDARLIRIFEGPTEVLEMHLGSLLTNRKGGLDCWLNQDNAKNYWESLTTDPSEGKANISLRPWHMARKGRLGALSILKATMLETASGDTKTIDWISDEINEEENRWEIHSRRIGEVSEASTIETIKGYSNQIGMIQQSLPGEDNKIDPMFTRESHETRGTVAFPKSTPLSSTPSVTGAVPEQKEKIETKLNPIVEPSSLSKQPARAAPEAPAVTNLDNQIETNLRSWIAKSMQMPLDKVETTKPFTTYGFDSLAAYELMCKIEETYELTIPSNLVWDYPTIQSASEYITKALAKKRKNGSK